MTPDLAIATNWLRDHWDASPVRLHGRDLDDGGAPAYAPAFAAWIGMHPASKVERTIQQACSHRGGTAGDCADCAGTGVKTMFVTRYRWPMRAALFALRKRIHMPPGVVHYAEAVTRYAVMDFDAEAACAALGMTQEKGEDFLLHAIRALQGKYAEGPVGRPQGISEAQSIAEATAAA